MRKILGTGFILLSLLTACSLPALNPVPTVDLVGTQVAINLATGSAATSLPAPTSSLPTIAPTSSNSSATLPAASATTVETETTTPTLTITPTATGTVSATIQPSATTASSDPRSTLGNPTWKDIFQNGKNWGLETPYDDGNTRVEISNNAMVLTSANAQGWHGWRVSFLKIKNFYLEATLKTNSCSGNDQYGLIFHSNDVNNASGYWIGITCDGKFNLMNANNGSFSEIIKSKTSDAIHAGSNQTNRIGVMVKDSSISIYANGKLIGDVTDTTYPDAGFFGLFIAGQKTINFSFACTEFDYWEFK